MKVTLFSRPVISLFLLTSVIFGSASQSPNTVSERKPIILAVSENCVNVIALDQDRKELRRQGKGFLKNSDHNPSNEIAASMCLYHAALKEDLPSYAKLGALYLKGGGDLEKNLELGAELISYAAINGHTPSQINYGRLLEKGCGVEKNVEKAIQFFRLAAIKGRTEDLFRLADTKNITAEYEAAMILLPDLSQENSVMKDLAKTYLLHAASRGHQEAQYNYGAIMHKEQDYVSARIYLKSAADQGHTLAQYHYGVMLGQHNRGGAADFGGARRYTKMAADKGGPLEQLGHAKLLIAHRPGFDQDLPGARNYLGLAMAQGNENARKILDSIAGKNFVSVEEMANILRIIS